MQQLKSDIFEIYYVFNKILYNLGSHPLKVSIQSKEIKIVVPKHRKILCWLFHILCVGIGILRLFEILRGKTIKNDPPKLFRVWAGISSTLTLMQFSRICLKNNGNFGNLLTGLFVNLPVMNLKKNKLTNNKRRFVAAGICLFALSQVIVVYVCNEIGDYIRSPTIGHYVDSVGVKAGSLLQFSNDTFPLDESITTGKVWAVILYHLMMICLEIIYNFQDLPVILSCYAFYLLSKDFWTAVHENDDTEISVAQLSSYYGDLKDIVEHINSIIGQLVILFVMTSIPYCAMLFIEIFDTDNWAERIQIMYYTSIYIVALSLAAEGNRKIQRFEEYFHKNFVRCRDFQKLESISLMQSMEIFKTNSNVGIGCNGVFVITYTFLGNAVSSMMTYVIITLQFHSSK